MHWPPIADGRLASRLSMGEREFSELALKLARRVPARQFSEDDYRRACAYPWHRAEQSFRLANGKAEPLENLADLPQAMDARFPLLAFGSNAAPTVLSGKLAALAEDQRDVLALTGELSGFAIAPSAHLALYGALPATIVRVAAGGTRAALLMVTAEQFELLTQTEFNYALARIDSGAFETDLELELPGSIFAYVSRWGAFAPEGIDLAIDAGQAELLEHAAKITLGESASGRALVERVFENYAWSVETAKPLLAGFAAPLAVTEWDLFSSRP